MSIVLLRKATSASEGDLKKFISQYPGEVEAGLQILKQDFEFDNSLADFLCRDGARRLTILQATLGDLEAHLLCGLAAIEWIIKRRDVPSGLYGREALNFDLMPRLILVGPSFSPALMASTKFIQGVELDFYAANFLRVNMVRDTGTETASGVMLERIPIEKAKKEEQKVALRSHVYAIEEKWLRDLCIDFIKKVKERAKTLKLSTLPNELLLRLPNESTIQVKTDPNYFQVHFAKREYSSRPIRSVEDYTHFWREFETFLRSLDGAPPREEPDRADRGEPGKVEERKKGLSEAVRLREDFIRSFPITNTQR